MFKFYTCFFIVVSFQLLIACSSKQAVSLYQEVGEQQGIERLVDAFVQRLGKDKQILSYFAKSSVTHFKKGFTNHLCEVVEGPCKYNGDSMVDIHTGMHINEADFNRTVELLIQAMEDVGISYSAQNKILAKLVPLRGEVIKI